MKLVASLSATATPMRQATSRRWTLGTGTRATMGSSRWAARGKPYDDLGIRAVDTVGGAQAFPYAGFKRGQERGKQGGRQRIGVDGGDAQHGTAGDPEAEVRVGRADLEERIHALGHRSRDLDGQGAARFEVERLDECLAARAIAGFEPIHGGEQLRGNGNLGA